MLWPRYGRCKSCLSTWRVEALGPSMGTMTIKYCPMCGRQEVDFSWNQKLDYWYTLAEGFGLEPNTKGVELVKELYRLWDPLENNNFGDFIRELLKGEEVK